MQVIVSHTFSPTIGDSATWAVADLCRTLKSQGHKYEDMLMPFDPRHSPMEQLLAFRLLEPVEYGDVMVTLHPPCHTTCHRGKVIWGIGRALRNEDLMPAGYFTQSEASRSELEALRVSDRLAFSEARRICLRSRTSCSSFQQQTQFPAVFLPLPPRVQGQGECEGPILAARVDSASPALLLLALEALAMAPPAVRLVLVGKQPFSRAEWSDLLSLHRIGSRVELLDLSEWPSALSRSMAVLGLSADADAFGESAIDAHGCGKPIVAFDSPASAEWIEDGLNGRLASIEAAELAAVLTALSADAARAKEMGLAGKELLAAWGANWDHAVKTLTEL